MKKILLVSSLLLISWPSMSWGFMAHRLINRMAVYSLPPELFLFYRDHIDFLSEYSTKPDERRYVNKLEGPRHYIDLDSYPDSLRSVLYHGLDSVEVRFDSLFIYEKGILPWEIERLKYNLTLAFMEKDTLRILRLTSFLGHYLADSQVPLHTTRNYNGQFTGQYGIHGLWETRLPELFSAEYNLWVGKATYRPDTRNFIWSRIRATHKMVENVLQTERELSETFPSDRKYSYEQRGKMVVKVYSEEFCGEYHRLLGGMVERQLRSSIQLLADFIYTCWADAGQPVLIRN